MQAVKNALSAVSGKSPATRYTSLPQTASNDNTASPPPAYASPMLEKADQSHSLNNQHASQVEAPPSRLAVTGSVSFYLVAALVMVMVNKWVLNAVPVPLFFLLIQLVTAVILLHLTACFGFFRVPEVRMSTCKGLVPLIAINCIGLAFNTYCLQFVDASFYQVARGLVLPFTTALSAIYLKTRPSMPILMAILVVCFGFLVGVAGEDLSGTSGIGIILGVLSSVTTAGHAIVVKRSLPVVNGSAMDLAYYQNFLSAFVMAPAAMLAETRLVMDMFAIGGEDLRTFWVGGLVTGAFGFLICIAGFVSIKVTSPVTHMVSAAVRGVIQTCLGVWIFNDIITSGRLSGISLILFGSIFYTWLKDKEMTKAALAAKLANTMPLVNRSTEDLNKPETNVVFDMDDSRVSPEEQERALLEADRMIADEEKAKH